MSTPPTLSDVYEGGDLPNPDNPKMDAQVLSHPGEHHGDHGTSPVIITRAVYIYTLCAAINSCNLGYDIGVNTGAGRRVQDDMELSDGQREIFIGAINFFAMFGALGSHWISDRFGRRFSFVVAAVGFIIGVLIQSVSPNYGVLMFGRVFVGLGVGFGLAVDPVYISEMSPAAHRGELVTWSEFGINVGIVLGFAAGLIQGENSWRFMFALGAILPIVMIALVYTIMPETPRWLLTKNRDQEAHDVLKTVYPAGFDVDPIAKDIRESIARDEAAEGVVGWDMIFKPTPAFRRMLIVGVGTAVSQQAVGIDSIIYFLVDILDQSGVKSETGQTLILIFLGLVKLGFIVLGSKLMDRKGRRPLFFVSLIGMFIALVIAASNFAGAKDHVGLAIFAYALFLAFFSLGVGPGAWLVPSEIFPTCIRAKAMSVATFSNRACATLMASTFLSTANGMGYTGFFFLLAGVCVVIYVFIYFLLPETKGRSLEDMSLYFAEVTGDNSILEAEARLRQELEMNIVNGSAARSGTKNSVPLSGGQEEPPDGADGEII